MAESGLMAFFRNVIDLLKASEANVLYLLMNCVRDGYPLLGFIGINIWILTKTKQPAQSRFLDFPDDILRKIFSSLDQKDAVKLRILSKRCLNLCDSKPKVQVNLRNIKLERRDDFLRFVDKYWLGESRLKNIEVLEVYWMFLNVSSQAEKHILLKWLENALLNNNYIKELTLDLTDNQGFELPSFIFSLQSLKTLSLHSIVLGYPFTSFPCLETLILNNIRGLNELNIISSSLRRVEIFSQYLMTNISVSSEQLRILSINFASRGKNASITLHTPNLTLFSLDGGAVLRSVQVPIFYATHTLHLDVSFAHHRSIVSLSPTFACFPNLKALKFTCFELAEIWGSEEAVAAHEQLIENIQIMGFDIKKEMNSDFGICQQIMEYAKILKGMKICYIGLA
ncbi:hypothetical protein DM860_000440 [Cuscuta australis]|uniref:F-box domain-containing protein n=1 Tax=Cuscuta australis TaxID=267555 RepID=A0A328CXB0_9ASTE|nr:hypothetical protein DM860_000440 [Cuscuta australis]